jgi:hypothetical protein
MRPAFGRNPAAKAPSLLGFEAARGGTGTEGRLPRVLEAGGAVGPPVP